MYVASVPKPLSVVELISHLLGALLMFTLSLSACDDSGSAEERTSGESIVDPTGDPTEELAGQIAGELAGQTSVPPAGEEVSEPPLEPPPEPLPEPLPGELETRTLLEWETWWVTPDRADSQLFGAIERGQLEPIVDGSGYGVSWSALEAGPEGQLDALNASRAFYATTRVTLTEETHLALKLGGVYELAVNGVRIPGDVYNQGRSLLPLTLPAGEHWLLLYAVRRGTPSARAWVVDQPVAFNLDDVTYSDLRVDARVVERPLGVPLLNFTTSALTGVAAWVMESEHVWATRVVTPSLPAHATTQVSFLVRLKRPISDIDEPVTLRLHIEATELESAYEAELTLTPREADDPYRVSFRSPVDGSVQYYGVRAPLGYRGEQDPLESSDQEGYASVLSLHGASVEAINLAASYSPKDWAFVITPTNRRPFGFDWEEWGHFNALATLEHARSEYPLDPTRSYLTGHSMGGHGTWHVGVHHPGLFATLGPSAGWQSFYTYGDTERPTEPVSWARAHSDTFEFLENIKRRGIYILHGDQDESVPVSEGREMYSYVRRVSTDVVYTEVEGAIHWWDGDASDGVDCVDWPELFEFMRERRLDPHELDFSFKSVSPAYSGEHSYLTLESAEYLGDPVEVTSAREGETVSLTTENARSLSVDVAPLLGAGVSEVIIDGERYPLDEETESPLWIGPRTGKQRHSYGGYQQVYRRPFCWIYPDDEAGDSSQTPYRDYVSYLTNTWLLIGNGHACALPYSGRGRARDEGRQLIFVGISSSDLARDEGDAWSSAEVSWSARGEVTTPQGVFEDSALMVVRPTPARDGVDGALFAAPDQVSLLYRLNPFSSRGGLPDLLIFHSEGARQIGYFGLDWSWRDDWVYLR